MQHLCQLFTSCLSRSSENKKHFIAVEFIAAGDNTPTCMPGLEHMCKCLQPASGFHVIHGVPTPCKPQKGCLVNNITNITRCLSSPNYAGQLVCDIADTAGGFHTVGTNGVVMACQKQPNCSMHAIACMPSNASTSDNTTAALLATQRVCAQADTGFYLDGGAVKACTPQPGCNSANNSGAGQYAWLIYNKPACSNISGLEHHLPCQAAFAEPGYFVDRHGTVHPCKGGSHSQGFTATAGAYTEVGCDACTSSEHCLAKASAQD